MVSLRPFYQQTVVPALQRELGHRNVWQLPRLEKVVLNVGISSSHVKDQQFVEHALGALRKISGQQPIKTLAKQSISNFKTRQGQVVGLVVTLRGERMWSFLDKLIHVTLPRVRDFRGLDPKSVDASGNLSIGLKESIAFPEIAADDVEHIAGVQITVVSTAASRKSGEMLFRLLGFPFRRTGS